jgi:hypothetical protein
MAKKVRRVKKKNKRSDPVVDSTSEMLTEQTDEQTISAKEKAALSYQQEYAYVIKDLRHLLLVSGALFLLLIVINLLLQ